MSFFNQFVNATGKDVEGWVDSPAQELSNGRALVEFWLQG